MMRDAIHDGLALVTAALAFLAPFAGVGTGRLIAAGAGVGLIRLVWMAP